MLGFWEVFFGCAAWHVGCYFPYQGSNPCPLQWKRGVLTTGLPGNSLYMQLLSWIPFPQPSYPYTHQYPITSPLPLEISHVNTLVFVLPCFSPCCAYPHVNTYNIHRHTCTYVHINYTLVFLQKWDHITHDFLCLAFLT